MAGVEQTKLAISNFICEWNKDIQDFLHNSAIRFEQANRSRTYLIIDEERSNSDSLYIYAYFTIAIKHMEISESVSGSKRKKLDGISKEAESVICYLIGQLGKNDFFRYEIEGKEILDYAMSLISDIFDKIGGRFVLVECENEPKLIQFYEDNGFQFIQRDGEFVQLVRYLSIKEL